MRSIDWKNKPKQLLRKRAEWEALRTFILPANSPALKVRVTSQEFKRLAKLHAAAGKKPGPCWHEVLLREKGKRNEYRCAVCKTLLETRRK